MSIHSIAHLRSIMTTKEKYLLGSAIAFVCLFFKPSCSLTDTIYQGQELKSWQNLTSANGIYNLQFLSTSKSYLGIVDTRTYFVDPWLEGKIMWLANRNNPIPDVSSVLSVEKNGTLKIAYTGGSIILESISAARNVSATLLDSGNFVLRELSSDRSVGKFLWQSFDHPTSFLFPEMKIGIDYKTNRTGVLTSWVSPEVPADGSFTLGVDPVGTNQLVIWYMGNIYWTSGPCINGRFKDAPMDCRFISNKDGKFFSFPVTNDGLLNYFEMNTFGYLWLGQGKLVPIGACYRPRQRGCEDSFVLPECRNNLHVSKFNIQKGFVYQKGIKFENSSKMSLFDCQDKCFRDCSCMAFASMDNNRTGCEIWENGLSFNPSSSSWARDVYFPQKIVQVRKWRARVIIAGGITLALVACLLCYLKWRKVQKERKRNKILSELGVSIAAANNKGKDENNQDFHVFSFECIAAATKHFCMDNKLGEGGFGPVYKGNLPNGQVMAVKRLSRSSGQGLVEFKNEILLIAKLQHKNLVRLLGCCIEAEEKLLIYEYMPNKSLDFFLFNCHQDNVLDWLTRFKIIEGIAQGILYLHKYSRLRIIHRDLKASNILLDDDMNPRISDFGMARIFGHNESQANTMRVVGTYGYMSPEYAMEGTFSIKSDVFSFGVLLLEIVSGKRNNTIYHHSGQLLNLIAHAWKLLIQDEREDLELVDPVLRNSYMKHDEVSRCIKVGLLCVQENPRDRPDMSDVISMLANETTTTPLRRPKQPAFFLGRSNGETDNFEKRSENESVNNVTISILEAR